MTKRRMVMHLTAAEVRRISEAVPELASRLHATWSESPEFNHLGVPRCTAPIYDGDDYCGHPYPCPAHDC